jgi:hypothetical protein
MKGFKKLILSSAILAASSSALAMQAMDEESMAATTGQDGITITLNTNVTTDIKWIDRNGTASAGFTHAGALIINDVNIVSTGLRIDIDAGGDTGSGAGANGMLNIGVYNPNGITINLGAAGLQAADADTTVNYATDAFAARSATGQTATSNQIITFNAGASLSIAASSGRLLDIELGSEADNFIQLNGNLGNISLTGMNIIDADGGVGADISIGTLTLANIALTNATVDVIPAGLTINTGTGLNNVSVGLERLAFGDDTLAGNGFIGDVYLTGLDISNNTVTVSGH